MVVAPLAASASIAAASAGQSRRDRSAWPTSSGTASAGRPRQTMHPAAQVLGPGALIFGRGRLGRLAEQASARSATPAAAAAWPAAIRRRPAASGSGVRRAARSSAPEPAA